MPHHSARSQGLAALAPTLSILAIPAVHAQSNAPTTQAAQVVGQPGGIEPRQGKVASQVDAKRRTVRFTLDDPVQARTEAVQGMR